MAFFDEIGKKISQTGQGAVSKTKNVAETIRINGLIGESEKQLTAYYTQLGREYFERNKDNPDPALAQIFIAIETTRNTIADYAEQVNQLRGVAVCPKCNAEIAPETVFCSNCGENLKEINAVAASAAPSATFCPGCGGTVAAGAAFCTSCGHHLA